MPTLELIEDDALYAPNDGGQQGFMDDYTHRYIAMAGGWFAGKTWAGARKLIDLHVFNAFDWEGNATGVDSCIIAQTYQLAETINIPEMRKALDEAGLKYRFVSDKTKYWFELPGLCAGNDPSLIYVRTADSPDKITGFTVGAIWGDEVARWKSDDNDPLRDPMLQAKGRLRDGRARFLQFAMTFTHEGDATKVYEDFEAELKPDHQLYRAGTFENPHAKEFGTSLESQLTPELAKQYLGGTAMSLRGGLVYSSYGEQCQDLTLQLVDDFPLQLSIDFNISPGMHGIIGQHIPSADVLTSVYELHAPRMDVRQMMDAFRDLVEKTLGGWKWSDLILFGDASGESKWAGSGESCWDIVREKLKLANIPYKMRVLTSNPPVSERVNSVNVAMAGLDGRVRYKIHPKNCPRLAKDYKSLKWVDGEIDKRDRKLSHPSDADGYRVHFLMPIRKWVRREGGRVGIGS